MANGEAVVHVRRSARDLSKRGRFERAVVARIAGDAEAAFIDESSVPPRGAGVVELFVDEIRTDPPGTRVNTSPCGSMMTVMSSQGVHQP